MTTYAPHETTRDERVRQAWTTYRDTLVELDGPQYDAAEAESWDQLQRTLREIDDEAAGPGQRAEGPAPEAGP